MMDFIHFNDITMHDENSWKSKSILSFDVDWASDDVVKYLLDILDSFEVKATFFITHDSPILNELKCNKNIELGIHPNFNPYFEQDNFSKPVNDIVKELVDLTESNIIRNHSLTMSSRWNDVYLNNGIKYSSNYCLYGLENNRPFYLTNSLIEVPVYFFDDASMAIKEKYPEKFHKEENIYNADFNGIKVFGFHPIHVALNSNTNSFYEETRSIHRNLTEIIKIQNKENGIKDILKRLIQGRK